MNTWIFEDSGVRGNALEVAITRAYSWLSQGTILEGFMGPYVVLRMNLGWMPTRSLIMIIIIRIAPEQ